MDGKTFIQTNKLDNKFMKNLGAHGLKMVEELTRLRNHATSGLMSTAKKNDVIGDACADDAHQGIKRSRKDLYDEIPRAIDIEVVLMTGDRVQVGVLTTPTKRTRLSVHLTDANMSLLTKKPDNSQAPYVPTVGDHCEWIQHRFSVRIAYFDGERLRGKTKKVSQEGDLQSEVDKTCAELSQFRAQHHVDQEG